VFISQRYCVYRTTQQRYWRVLPWCISCNFPCMCDDVSPCRHLCPCQGGCNIVQWPKYIIHSSLKLNWFTCTCLYKYLDPEISLQPIPVTVRSKQQVCGCSLFGIAGSNSVGNKGICLLWILCGTGRSVT